MKHITTIILALVCSLFFMSSVFALGPAELGAIFIVSFVGLLIFWFVVLFFIFAGVIFWLWMFIDCLVREDFRCPNDKIVWVVVLLFASILGAVLYFFIVKRRRKKNVKKRVNRSRPAAKKTGKKKR